MTAPSGDSGFAGAPGFAAAIALALFAHDAQMKSDAAVVHEDATELTGPDGSAGVASPIQGTIAAISVAVGDAVRQGQQVAIVEAMNMEHVIAAPHGGIVRGVTMTVGDVVREGFPIVFIEEADVAGGAVTAGETLDPDHIRDDLRENIERHALTLDEKPSRRDGSPP